MSCAVWRPAGLCMPAQKSKLLKHRSRKPATRQFSAQVSFLPQCIVLLFCRHVCICCSRPINYLAPGWAVTYSRRAICLSACVWRPLVYLRNRMSKLRGIFCIITVAATVAQNVTGMCFGFYGWRHLFTQPGIMALGVGKIDVGVTLHQYRVVENFSVFIGGLSLSTYTMLANCAPELKSVSPLWHLIMAS